MFGICQNLLWHSIFSQSLFLRKDMAQAKVSVPAKTAGVKETEKDVEDKEGMNKKTWKFCLFIDKSRKKEFHFPLPEKQKNF